ncbi:MAG: ribonucrease [Nocardioidaceae bacterium]|jgi:ribonuclease Y|nr:ribonucrease [Nocardioidaceae bacterium]
MIWLGLLSIAVLGALCAIAVGISRARRHRDGISPGQERLTTPEAAPTRLEPLVRTATDAVHSEASSGLHHPAQPPLSEQPAALVEVTSPTAPSSTASGLGGTRAAPLGSASPQPPSASHLDPANAAAAAAVQQALAALRDREDEVSVLRQDLHEQHVDLERRERRLSQREERLDDAARLLDERAGELAHLDDELTLERNALLDIAADRRAILESLAELTAEEARAALVADIERDAKREAAVAARDIERIAISEAESRARDVLATAIQRLASEQTAESVVSLVRLPGDDMKGRIIGREGRNIRSFEQTTGVNLIIDDTPEAVVLSCFDPVRREVGRITLEELVADGRIHPSRIEEVYERSLSEVDRLCQRAGEDALVEVGVTDLHPHLVFTLGQLRYRTSYGQNVLKHLVESAHAAGLIAAELGIDATVVKRSALLHDIGKALTHEAEGSHALVGAELAHRYGESAEVVHAIEAHHNEVEPRTIEAVLTQAADAISGGRPGARRESPEAYVKRLERLEEIAMACDGVEKVYAMQAGREIRVMVLPEVVDDIGAQVLARDIVKQVEHELTYPGQIKVTVIRESRTTEIAR